MATVILSQQPTFQSTVTQALPEQAEELVHAHGADELAARWHTPEVHKDPLSVVTIVDATSSDPLQVLTGIENLAPREIMPIVAVYDASTADELTVASFIAAGVQECLPLTQLTSTSLREAMERARARVRAIRRSQQAQGAVAGASDVVGSLDDQRYRLIVEHARDVAIFTVDPAGHITSWNLGAERLLGYEEAEILGQPFSTIFTPADIEQGVVKAELREAQENGSASDFRWHVRRDGSHFWADGQLMVMTDGDGERVGYLKILQDRTEVRKTLDALREERDRHMLALRAADAGSWRRHQRTHAFRVDDRARQLFALSANEVSLEELLTKVEPADCDSFRRFLKQLCQTPEESHSCELHASNDTSSDGRVTKRLLVSGLCRQTRDIDGAADIIGTVQDITEPTQVEEVLQDLTSSLKRDLAEQVAWSDELKRFAHRLSTATGRMQIHAAQTLHEHVQQILVAARNVSAVARNRVNAKMREQLDNVEDLLKQALTAMHSLAEELYPPVLYENGLAAGLQWLVHKVEMATGMSIELHTEGFATKTSVRNIDTFAFDLVRRMLHLLVNHGHKKGVEVKAYQRPDELAVVIEEAEGGVKAIAGHPEVNDLERQAQVFDGTFRIESRRDGGSRLTVKLPLRRQP